MLFIASAVTLIPMIVSDIRTREVNILWLLVFGVIQLYFNGTENIFFNVCLLLIMLSGIYLYLVLKYGPKSRITEFIGTGDIFFIITLTAAFPIREFTYFLLTGFVISLLFWILMPGKNTIPLVSTIGTTYLIWLLTELI